MPAMAYLWSRKSTFSRLALVLAIVQGGELYSILALTVSGSRECSGLHGSVIPAERFQDYSSGDIQSSTRHHSLRG